ncbi:MAG: hypothetical protein QG656_2667 [Candidatus Hydrogenedentes bacterium]|nr:hypothetical protein [Candidatus Hydrogenedentota bacterium]
MIASRCLRISMVACVALALMPMAHAQDGWINLFDQETLFGWTVLGNAEWGVAEGVMAVKHAKGTSGWIATTSQFGDFELTAKVRVQDGGSAAIAVRAGLSGHPSENGGSWVTLSEPEKTQPDYRTVAITAQGDKVTATVDGTAVEVLGGGSACGYIGILYQCTAKVEVSEMRLKPLGFTPLFNGQNLDGWNIIPDHASVFSVVDGAINIKNGNGQIETAGLYKDFLLQLDIISNGDSLNSGVFYRGPVGVFWKGYESQVRNQWTRDDRTRPVDFGTGGNYGNQQARKVVSSDREWFQKTVVCSGNHTAIWINGYLASDWLDMRAVSPESNGKEGYVPGPGTIHLQGHDPTTDLSFKNINIQVYPGK